MPLSKEIVHRIVNALNRDQSVRQIAEALQIHPRTVRKYKTACEVQRLPRDVNNKIVGIPQPGKQGGYRWSRMGEEQKQMCARIAVENPNFTIAQVRDRLQEIYPQLTVSESTVWRCMRASNLQYMRARMKDPRREGTKAHQAELAAFKAEQAKGSEGAFAVHDLFFMDETTVYLNEVPRRAWGTKQRCAEVDQAKGKTQTIAIYAGLGLVSATPDRYAPPETPSTLYAPTHAAATI